MENRRGYYGRGYRGKGVRYIESLIDQIVDIDVPRHLLSGEDMLSCIEDIAASKEGRGQRHARKASAILALIDVRVDALLEEVGIERK